MDGISNDTNVYSNLGLTTTQNTETSNGLKLDDFMNLMVTELTHQDPFKPMENTELATQISQFATVSGIDQLNGSFASLSDSLLSDKALQAAGLVGREVLVASQIAPLPNGGSVSGVIDLPASASQVTLRISDANGALVREIEMGSRDAGSTQFTWDGYDDAGDYMSAGLYQVDAVATIDDVEMAPQVLVNAQVGSVSVGGASGQDLVLNLDGLGGVALSSVSEIR